MSQATATKWLCLVTFVDLFAISMVVPLLGAHLRTLGASHFTIGAMKSVYAGIQLLSGPVFGSWSDIRGCRHVLMVTLLACSFSYILMGYTAAMPVICLTRIILGVFKQTQTLCKSWAADLVPESQQPELYGRLNSMAGIGFMIGPAIGGHLAEIENGFMYICGIVTLAFWTNLGIVCACLPDSHTNRNHSNFQGSSMSALHSELKRAIILLKHVDWSIYWDIFILKFLVAFSQQMFFSNYSLQVQENFKVSLKWVGYTISFQGMIGAISSFILVGVISKLYHTDYNYNIRKFHSFLLLTVAYIALSIVPSFRTYILFLVPLSAAGSFLRIILMESVIQRTPQNQRGSVIGSSNNITSISRLVAPLCSGALYDFFGSQGIFVTITVISALGTILAGSLVLAKAEKSKKL